MMAQNDFLEGVRKGMIAYQMTRRSMQEYQGNQLQMETERMRQDALKREQENPTEPPPEGYTVWGGKLVPLPKQEKPQEQKPTKWVPQTMEEAVKYYAETTGKKINASTKSSKEPKDTRPKLLQNLNISQESWDSMPYPEREAMITKYTNGKGKLVTNATGEPTIESIDKGKGKGFTINVDKSYNADSMWKKTLKEVGFTDPKLVTLFNQAIGEPGMAGIMQDIAGGNPDDIMSIKGKLIAFKTLREIYVPPDYRARVGAAIENWYASEGTEPLFPSLPVAKNEAKMREQLIKTFGSGK